MSKWEEKNTKQQHTYTHRKDLQRIKKSPPFRSFFYYHLQLLLFYSWVLILNTIFWCNGKFYNELKYNSMGSHLLPPTPISPFHHATSQKEKAPNNKWEKCFLINKVFKLRKLTWRPQDFSTQFSYSSQWRHCCISLVNVY